MRNGDLSNRSAPVIAFRVEDFLVRFKTNRLIDKVLNFIVGKERRAELDPDVVSALNFIFKHTDMTVELIVDKNNNTDELVKVIEHLPYGRLTPIRKPVEIAILLNVGDISYYVDNDEERISLVGHRHCITLEELNTLIRGR